MRKQDLILNLILTLSLGSVAWKLHSDWRNYAAHNGPQALEAHSLSGVSLPPLSVAPDYTAVARQNPFHAERNDVIEQSEAQAKPTGPPPLVYGSIIMGDTRFALMANEQSPKTEKVSEGDTFEGYKLVKVLPESVVLESSAGRSEIMFYNALMRLRRQGGKTVSTAASQAATSTSVTASSPGAGTAQTDMANTKSLNPAPGENPLATPTLVAPPGKEVMDTPFGPVLVDKKKP
jgi:type II secretory pathway component PulC